MTARDWQWPVETSVDSQLILETDRDWQWPVETVRDKPLLLETESDISRLVKDC